MSLSYIDKKVYLTNLSFWGENKLSKIRCQHIRKIFDKKKVFLPTHQKQIDVSGNKAFFRPKLLNTTFVLNFYLIPKLLLNNTIFKAKMNISNSKYTNLTYSSHNILMIID